MLVYIKLTSFNFLQRLRIGLILLSKLRESIVSSDSIIEANKTVIDKIHYRQKKKISTYALIASEYFDT